MPSKPPDRLTGDVPDEFDLDVRFEEPKISGEGFQMMSLVDCPDGTRFCPGPGTGCTCFGATGIDTDRGATCIKMCGETRGGTCLKFCIDTIHGQNCGKIFTRRLQASTCFGTCHRGCNAPAPAGTNSVECG